MRHDRDMSRWAYWALLFFTLVVAAVTFLLSFSGLDDYGRRVARLGDLSPLVPLGVDGLTLCAVAATFILRRAPWHVRAYAWCVFAVAVAASVAGNLSHAAARRLAWDGMIGAAAWPILLALASHLVIVTRRAIERADTRRADAATPVPASRRATRPTAAPATPGETSDSHTTETSAATATTRPAARSVRATRRSPASPDSDTARTNARRRVGAGESCATVALSLAVSKKTVERWTEDIRAARQRQPATAAGDSDSDAEPAERVS